MTCPLQRKEILMRKIDKSELFIIADNFEKATKELARYIESFDEDQISDIDYPFKEKIATVSYEVENWMNTFTTKFIQNESEKTKSSIK